MIMIYNNGNGKRLRMKKQILIVSVLMLSVAHSLELSAQDSICFHRHEISVSVGVGSNMGDGMVKNMMDNHPHYGILRNSIECGNIWGDSFIMLNLGYHYRLNKNWSLGAIFGFGISNEPYDVLADESAETEKSIYIGDFNEQSRIFYVAPSFRYDWNFKKLRQSKLNIYSRVALGVMRERCSYVYSEKGTGYSDHYFEKKWKMAYQVTPIGVDFGTRPIILNCELGYGVQGMLIFGLKYIL